MDAKTGAPCWMQKHSEKYHMGKEHDHNHAHQVPSGPGVGGRQAPAPDHSLSFRPCPCLKPWQRRHAMLEAVTVVTGALVFVHVHAFNQHLSRAVRTCISAQRLRMQVHNLKRRAGLDGSHMFAHFLCQLCQHLVANDVIAVCSHRSAIPNPQSPPLSVVGGRGADGDTRKHGHKQGKGRAESQRSERRSTRSRNTEQVSERHRTRGAKDNGARTHRQSCHLPAGGCPTNPTECRWSNTTGQGCCGAKHSPVTGGPQE